MKIKQKLQLVYIKWQMTGCIAHPHFDLCTLEKNPLNVACILTDAEGAKLIRKWIKIHNKGINNA